MKKLISYLIVIISLLSLSLIILSGCGGDNVNWMEDLTNYCANLKDATALGISSNSNNKASVCDNGTNDKIKPLSFVTTLKSNKNDVNYFYKTTTEYDANDPTVDENGLIKVTFTKITTKNDEEEKVISQEEVGGEIDKLYVLGNYTFVSYVPKGKSERPSNNDLIFDSDGISKYDKCNYFSNSKRQSFIIDNKSGLIYKIKDFNIKEINGGCLLSANDNFVYDFKINENKEVEIFSLFQNETITWYSCFKDKYGNKYVQNNRLNLYDDKTKTYFYVFAPQYDFGDVEIELYSKLINYELTENNECIKFEYDLDLYNHYLIIKSAKIILEDGSLRDLTVEDSFKIYYNPYKNARFGLTSGGENEPYNDYHYNVSFKVENGVVYSFSPCLAETYMQGFSASLFNCVNEKFSYYLVRAYETLSFYNTSYLTSYGLLLEYHGGKLHYYKNFWDTLKTLSTKEGRLGFEPYLDINSNPIYGQFIKYEPLTNDTEFNPILVLDNCSIDEKLDSFLTYGVSGNTYYDIVAEEQNGELIINKYLSGTYEKPQLKIILQPINK